MTDFNNIEPSSVQNKAKLNKAVKNRRNFLKKATVGATLASIPAHSVWAGRLISGNMSGNVSGWGECQLLAIWSHGKYKIPTNNGRIYTPLHQQTWAQVFGATRPPFDGGDKTKKLETFIGNGGNPSINAQLVAMYFNAALHGQYGIYWPVVANGMFNNAFEYAEYLWDQANTFGPGTIAGQLGDIIDEHHAGGEGLKATC